MRTKKKQPLAAPDLTAAWAAVIQKNQKTDIVTLRAEGWKTVSDVALETVRSEISVRAMLRSQYLAGHLEALDAKVPAVDGKLRDCRLYRPVLK